MKTKLILTRLRSTFGTLRFDARSFFNTLLRVRAFLDYKLTNAILADSPGVYTSERILNLCAIDEIYSKCDVIDGSVINGKREPILFSFVLEEPSGYKMFCEPETIHYKK